MNSLRGRSGRAAVATAAALGLVACGGSGGGDGDADDYPDTEIEMIVPFSAGGPTDTVARLVAVPMGEELGQTVIVENVEGAGGTVGAGQAARADGDGYTIFLHHIGMATAPALYDNLNYEPLEDFKTVGLVTHVPMTLVANNDFPADTLEDFLALVESDPDSITLGFAGVGSASNLCSLLLEDTLGVDFAEVSYDGTGPAMTALLGGEIDFMCDQTTNTSSQILDGGIKAFAVTTPDRVESLPEVPTTEEGGLGDFQVSIWHGLYVPADTPDPIVEKLTAALQVALEDQTVIDQFASLGTAPVSQEEATPAAHTELLTSEIDLWSGILGSE